MAAVAQADAALADLAHGLAAVRGADDLEIVVQAAGGGARLVAQALAVDAHLLSEAEIAKIRATIAKLREAAAGDNRRAINIAMDDLGYDTQEFAHRRMDQSIKKVLSGRKVDDIKIGEEGEQA